MQCRHICCLNSETSETCRLTVSTHKWSVFFLTLATPKSSLKDLCRTWPNLKWSPKIYKQHKRRRRRSTSSSSISSWICKNYLVAMHLFFLSCYYRHYILFVLVNCVRWTAYCVKSSTPCGLWGCKNRPAPFPGQMS